MIKELLKKPGAVKYFAELDFSKNKELHELVKLAAEICDTPYALITFLHEDKQLLKVRFGTQTKQTRKKDSFCKFISDPGELLIVPDASKDDRFTDNPLVTGEWQVRFYAGAPLSTDYGEILGSLCVLSSKPQQLTEKQKEILSMLSRQAYKLMELELNNVLLKEHARELENQTKELTNSSNKLRAIFESSPDCFMLLDPKLNIMAYNNSLASFVRDVRGMKVKTGMDVTKIISKNMIPVYKKYCNTALNKGKSTIRETLLHYQNGQDIWWRISFNPAYDSMNNRIGITVNAKNINERKEFEEKILQQNMSLRKIAFMQSHELRKPLANIMGLISLIKNSGDFDEIHSKLEKSALDLDDKLRDAIRYIEELEQLSCVIPE